MKAPRTDTVLIGIVGRAGSGKDTAATHLCRHYGFMRASFAGALKSMLEVHLEERGIDHAYLHEPGLKEQTIPQLGLSARELMQRQGDAFRTADPDFWVKALADALGMAGPRAQQYPVHDRIVITDVRYPNECDWVHANGGTVVRLVREQAAPVRAHSSEQFSDVMAAHHTLVNNGPLYGLHTLLDGMMNHCGIDCRDPLEDL